MARKPRTIAEKQEYLYREWPRFVRRVNACKSWSEVRLFAEAPPQPGPNEHWYNALAEFAEHGYVQFEVDQELRQVLDGLRERLGPRG